MSILTGLPAPMLAEGELATALRKLARAIGSDGQEVYDSFFVCK